MRWVRQNPLTEDACGQCSAAMLLDIGKREAIARVGHDLGTTTREMIDLLRGGGLEVASRLRRMRSFDEIPTRRALLLGYWKTYPHWMAWNRGRVFDPVEGIFHVEKDGLPRTLKVTHHLWVAWPDDQEAPRTRARAALSAGRSNGLVMVSATPRSSRRWKSAALPVAVETSTLTPGSMSRSAR